MESLKYLYLELTRACNQRCVQCFNNSRDPLPGEVPTTSMCDILDHFKHQGGERLQITGGDPLVRRDFNHILDHAARLQFSHVTLSTNGLLLTERKARFLEGKVQEIDLSVDGFELEHDLLRGLPCWSKSIAAVKHAVATGALTFVCCCVSKPLLPRIDEFIELLISLGVHSIKLAQIGEVGRRATPEALRTSHLTNRQLYDLIQPSVLKYARHVRIYQSLSLCPEQPSVARDGLVCDPCGRLFPLIGFLPEHWMVGRAHPEWHLSSASLGAYVDEAGKALREGIQLVARGEPVNWWTLIHDRLERSQPPSSADGGCSA